MYEIDAYYDFDFTSIDDVIKVIDNVEQFYNKPLCIYDKYNYTNNIYVYSTINNGDPVIETGFIKDINNMFIVQLCDDEVALNGTIDTIVAPKICSANEMIEYLNTHEHFKESNTRIQSINIMNDFIQSGAMHINDICFLDLIEKELSKANTLTSNFLSKKIWLEEVFCSLTDNGLSVKDYELLKLGSFRNQFFKAIEFDKLSAYETLLNLEVDVIEIRKQREEKELLNVLMVNNEGQSTFRIRNEIKSFQNLLNGTIQLLPLVKSLDGNVEAFVKGDDIDLSELSKVLSIKDAMKYKNDGLVFYRYDEESQKRTSLLSKDKEEILTTLSYEISNAIDKKR